MNPGMRRELAIRRTVAVAWWTRISGVATAAGLQSVSFATSTAGHWVAGQSPEPSSLPPEERAIPGTCQWTYKTIRYEPRSRRPQPPPFLLCPPPDLRRKYVLPPNAVVIERAYPNAGPTPAAEKKSTRGVVPAVRNEMEQRLAQSDARLLLFSEDNPDRPRPGDVVLVETWNSVSAKQPDFKLLAPMERPSVAGGLNTTFVSRFGGVILKITRKGPDSNFTVRNVILGVGVNIIFPLFSPLIKSIRVARRKVLVVPPDRKKKRTPTFVREFNKATLHRTFNVRELYAEVNMKEDFSAVPYVGESRRK